MKAYFVHFFRFASQAFDDSPIVGAQIDEIQGRDQCTNEVIVVGRFQVSEDGVCHIEVIF